MKQNCFSLRPGTLLQYQGQTWKVLSNDTLNRKFMVQTVNPRRPTFTKVFRYTPGQEISITWKPDTRL